MTDALLESIDADAAIHNVKGGIRNGLPEGELTFGAVYEMFPFDNRVVLLNLTGEQLRTVRCVYDRVLIGRVVNANDTTLQLMPSMLSPNHTVDIEVSRIRQRTPSDVSPM